MGQASHHMHMPFAGMCRVALLTARLDLPQLAGAFLFPLQLSQLMCTSIQAL